MTLEYGPWVYPVLPDDGYKRIYIQGYYLPDDSPCIHVLDVFLILT